MLILMILMLVHVSIDIIQSVKEPKTYKVKKFLDIVQIILGALILLTIIVLQDGFLMFLCWVFIFTIKIKTYQLHKEVEMLDYAIKAAEKLIKDSEVPDNEQNDKEK